MSYSIKFWKQLLLYKQRSNRIWRIGQLNIYYWSWQKNDIPLWITFPIPFIEESSSKNGNCCVSTINFYLGSMTTIRLSIYIVPKTTWVRVNFDVLVSSIVLKTIYIMIYIWNIKTCFITSSSCYPLTKNINPKFVIKMLL